MDGAFLPPGRRRPLRSIKEIVLRHGRIAPDCRSAMNLIWRLTDFVGPVDPRQTMPAARG
jgi:hypothetical protein